MRQRTYRLGAVACAALLAALAVAAPVSAAAPWIIIVDGEQLEEPVYIADYFDNYDLLGSREPGDTGDLDGRPYLDLYLFWGPNWGEYVSSGKPLEDLDPQHAGQRGRFYPAHDGQPAALYAPGVGGTDVVSEEGLEILQRYGIPVELDASPALPDTGIDAAIVEPDKTSSSWLALIIVLATTAAFVAGLGMRPRPG